MSIINPIDLARIGVLLKFDIRIDGYSGTVFNRFYGSYLGLLVSIDFLMLWIALPAWKGLRLFSKKDF